MNQDEKNVKRNYNKYTIFLFFPLMLAVIFCCAQISLNWNRTTELGVAIAPFELADYSEWERIEFAPLDSGILTQAAEENPEVGAFSIAAQATLTLASEFSLTPTATSTPTTQGEAAPVEEVDNALTATAETSANESEDIVDEINATTTAAVETAIALANTLESATETAQVQTSTAIPTSTTISTPTATSIVIGIVPTSTPFSNPVPTDEPSDPDEDDDNTETDPDPPSAADLQVSLAASPSITSIGNNVTLNIILNNIGDSDASNVVMNGTLPSQLTYISSSGCSGSGTTFTCNFGSVSGNNGTIAQIVARANSAGIGNATITAATSSSESSTSNNSASTTISVNALIADIGLALASTSDPIYEADTLTYSLTVNNSGPNAASSVQVNTFLPAGVTFETSVPGQGTYDSATGIWAVGSLANGGSATLTLNTTVNVGTAGQAQIFSASALATESDGDLSNNNIGTTNTVANQPDLQITVVPSSNPALTGEYVDYDVTVINNGTVTATNAVATVTVNGSLRDFILADCSQSGSTLTCNLGNIPVGSTATAQFTGRSHYSSGTTTFSAEVAADENDANLADNVVNFAGNVLTGSINIGEPDYVLRRLTCNQIEIDLSSSPIVDSSGYDFIVFEASRRSKASVVNMEPIKIEVRATPTDPWTVVFEWGTGIIYPNTSIGAAGYGSVMGKQEVPIGAPAFITLNGIGTGIGIDINPIVGAGSYPHLRISSTDCLSGSNIDIDSVYIYPASGADLEFVEFSISDTNPAVGDTVTATMRIINNGPETATNIVLGNSNGTGTIGNVQTGTIMATHGSYTGQKWTIPSLNSGETAILTFDLIVDGSSAGATVSRSREIESVDQTDPDSMPNNSNVLEDDYNSYSIDIQPLGVDLAVSQKAIHAIMVIGEITQWFTGGQDYYHYELTVTNNSTVDATNVTLSQATDATQGTLSKVQGDGTYSSSVWTVGNVPAGESRTIIVKIDSPRSSGASITSTLAIATVDQVDSDNSNDSNNHTLLWFADSISLAFDSTLPDLYPNKTFEQRFVVRNYRNFAHTGVQISYPVPAGVAFVSYSADQGTYDPVTGVWDVGTISSSSADFIDAELVELRVTWRIDSGPGGTTLLQNASVLSVNPTDPYTNNNSVSFTDNILVPIGTHADLAVLVAAPSTVYVGDTFNYIYTITNNGPDDATNVTFTDMLPAGFTYVMSSETCGAVGQDVTCNLGTIANGASLVMTVTVQVDSAPGGTNSAFVSADELDFDAGDNSASSNINTADVFLEIGIDLDNDSPSEGDTVVLTVTIDNYGSGSATNIRNDILIPAGLTYVSDDSGGSYDPVTGQWDIPVLASGFIFDLNIITTVDNGTAGDTITATATRTSVDQPDQSIGDDFDSVFLIVQSDLQLTALCSTEPSLVRRWRVRNTNPTPITFDWDIFGSSPLQAGTETVPAASGGTPGEIVFFSNVAAANVLRVTVGGVQHDTSASPDTPCNIDLSISKSIDNPTPDIGDTIEYTITLTNTSSSRDASKITVQDVLPGNLTQSSAVASTGFWDNVSEWAVASLPAGTSATLILRMEVTSGIDGQTITNLAQIMGATQPDSNSNNNTSSVDFTIAAQQPDIQVTKVVAGGSTIYQGIQFAYEITVGNMGTATASGVIMEDVLPVGLSFVSYSTSGIGGLCSEAVGTITCSIGTMNVGEQTVITMNVISNDSGNVNNTANVTLNETDKDTGNNSSTSMITVLPTTDLALEVSTSAMSPVSTFTNFTYTYTVTNNGLNDAPDTLVNILIPNNITYVSGCGASVGFTVLCNIGTLPAGASVDVMITVTGTVAGVYEEPVFVSSSLVDANGSDNTDSVSVTVVP